MRCPLGWRPLALQRGAAKSAAQVPCALHGPSSARGLGVLAALQLQLLLQLFLLQLLLFQLLFLKRLMPPKELHGLLDLVPQGLLHALHHAAKAPHLLLEVHVAERLQRHRLPVLDGLLQALLLFCDKRLLRLRLVLQSVQARLLRLRCFFQGVQANPLRLRILLQNIQASCMFRNLQQLLHMAFQCPIDRHNVRTCLLHLQPQSLVVLVDLPLQCLDVRDGSIENVDVCNSLGLEPLEPGIYRSALSLQILWSLRFFSRRAVAVCDIQLRASGAPVNIALE
mmetsp:Transcript_86942/g.241098  ORF Transcript_86942/g.241098 Transcript_86942/m.241098 type:complete len:282 (-) Transcript_86942:281-1126(-)